MADDWSFLAEGFEDDEDVLIGKMDCTKDLNRPLCQELGATAFPTLLYGDVTQLKDYTGKRELRHLRAVVEDHLDEPLCGVTHPELCPPKKQHKIQGLLAMGLPKVEEEIEEMEQQIEILSRQKDFHVDRLRKKYSAALTKKNDMKEEIRNTSKMMETILKMKELQEKMGGTPHEEL